MLMVEEDEEVPFAKGVASAEPASAATSREIEAYMCANSKEIDVVESKLKANVLRKQDRELDKREYERV